MQRKVMNRIKKTRTTNPVLSARVLYFTTMPRTIIYLFLLVGSMSGSACIQNADPISQKKLFGYFKPVTASDTLVFEVDLGDNVPTTSGDTIPNALFFSVLDSALLAEISHLADSASAVVLARQRFPITDEVEACLVDIRQSWFQHQSLLLYNHQQCKFTNRVTVAKFFGGDGGQMLTGSWLFDYDRDGHKDLVCRVIEHILRPDDNGEAIDESFESAMLLAWRQDRFVEQPLSDTMLVVKRYPIRSFW